jgi:hypothetical protein
MEQAYRMPLDSVRVHHDAAADRMATSLAAHAFTNGKDIFFRSGRYQPHTPSGDMLLAHELAHVVQAGAGPSPIRRNVGFEFEDASWHPWRVDRHQTHAIEGRPEVRPVPRKHKLHLGSGFRLEADDTPGPKQSNIEFVTEPFEEDANGVRALVTALKEMRDIITTLAPARGRPGPEGSVGKGVSDPPYPWDPYAYVTVGTHRLSGSTDVAADSLALSDGSPRGLIKMQATMGLTLGELPEAMRTYGSVEAGGETPEEEVARRPARALQQRIGFAKILGHGPALALQVLRGMIAEANLSAEGRNELADREKLKAAQGYLALIMVYLKGLAVPSNSEGAKYRTMFFARNKFSDLYGLLDPAVRRLFATDGGALLTKHVLTVSNANPLVSRVNWQHPDTDLTADKPLINPVILPERDYPGFEVEHSRNWLGQKRTKTVEKQFHEEARYNPHQQALSSFTIGTWLGDVAAGRDNLTVTAMRDWLVAHQGAEALAAKAHAEWVLESFGEYGIDRSGATSLALFENRGIAFKGQDNLTIDEAARTAANYLLHSALTKRKGPGQQYPSVDIPDW